MLAGYSTYYYLYVSFACSELKYPWVGIVFVALYLSTATDSRCGARAGPTEQCHRQFLVTGFLRAAHAGVVSGGEGTRATPQASPSHSLPPPRIFIVQAFQHLPEKRVWNIVSGFLSLFGDAAAAAAASATGPLAENGDAATAVTNSDLSSVPVGVDVDSGGGSGGSPQVVLLPAHFLAIAGTVDDWLPGWLRALSTGRLVRAVNDAGLVATMVRRIAALQPQVPFRPRRLNRPRRAEPAFGATTTDLGHRAAAFRPSLSAAAAAVVPPGDAVVPPLTYLNRALLLQSVSFLGTMAAHCRGNPRPSPPPGDAVAAAGLPAAANGNAPPGARCEGGPPERREASRAVGEGGLVVDLEQKDKQQGEEVMQALAQCVAREAPPAAEPAGGRVAPRQSYCSRRATPISVRCVALGYVGQVARAVAGTASTPFTPTVIDVLFSPLAGGSGYWNGSGRSGGQAGNSGGGGGGGSGVSFRHSRFNREENGGPPPPPPPSVGVKEEEEEEPASFFVALAEIAGVLLSSRGSLTGFFVDGPAGPEASHALLEIARCTAELAKYACWRHSSSNGTFSGSGSGSGSSGGALSEEKGDGKPVVLGSADAWESRFRWLGRRDAERLAVEFACALAPIMGYPPKQRAAGWAALWRCDVPYALAALTACLDNSPAPKGSASGKVDGGQRNSNRRSASGSLEGRSSGDGDERRSGGRGGDGGSNSGGEPWKRDCDLRDRLLLSLVEWARDLAGVSYLRKVGLAGPCASFLSRYLARRNLRPACRDECADPRPLALAARLSLCAEGLEGLLCADGGMADEVDAGLGRLEELMDLAELLPSQAAAGLPLPRQTPPSHALALAVGGTNSGFRGGGEGRGVDDRRGCSSASDHQRFSGMVVGGGGGAPDLRCLDFASRFSCSSTALPSSHSAVDSVGAAALRAERWLRWAVSLAVPEGPLPDTGGLAPEEEVAHAPEDVRVAAFGLAASLASDLTVAVAMEARWSLADALAPQQPVDRATRVAAVSSGSDAGGGGNTGHENGRDGDEEGDPEAFVSESRSGSNQARSGSRGGGRGGVMAAHIPDVLVPVEPAGLGCARLVVSLTSLGGPTEERRNRMRGLRDAEALAAAPSACLRGDAVAVAAATAAATATVTVATTASAAADAPDAGDVGVTSQHARDDLRGMAQVTHFPEDGLSDEDWWSAARQCVSTVVAVLANPRGPRTDEAFALLARAAAKRPALPPGPAAAAARAPGFTTANNRDGGTPRVPGSEGDMPGERPAVTAVAAATMAAMTKLLFSYARGLGLVDVSDRDRFGAGLRSTLAAAESVKSATTSPFFPFPFLSAHSAAGPAGEETRFDGLSCGGCDWFMAVVFLASGGVDGAAASGMVLGASRWRFPGASLAPPSLHAADEAGSRATELAAETSTAAASLAAAAVAGVAAHGSAGRAAGVPVAGTPRAPRLPPVSTVSTTTARFLPPITVSESRAAGKEGEKEEEEEIAAGVVVGAGASAGARAGVGAAAEASPSLLYVGAAAAARASLWDPPLLLLAALTEEIVEEELPGVSGALRAAGWAVAPLAVRWMRQCMLCVVDWPGVVAYLALTLLRGHDYQVCVILGRCTVGA